jgi:aryl-alcohol dehydrogenase-like predicted oxidoreductase
VSFPRSNLVDRLVLGTAQLGTPYGIANHNGQPDQGLANDILNTAWQSGIRILDTAQGYGESESVIGRFLKSHPECRFEVITKLAPDIDITSSTDITAAVSTSRENLGEKPAALMLHRYEQLDGWNGALKDCLCKMKEQGVVGHLGISLYDPGQFSKAMTEPEIDWIQAPFNVFDQRLKKDNLIETALKLGKQIFLRSAFLQGLLLMNPGSLPGDMRFAAPALDQWRGFCSRHQISPEQAALQYVGWANPEAHVVVGCETVEQLLANIRSWSARLPFEDIFKDMSLGQKTNPRLIDPSQWPPLSTT